MIFNHAALKLLTPPAFEPVSIALAKSHMRLNASFTADDALIAQYISAAREYCEDYTARAFLPQTYRYSLDQFPLLPNSQYAPGNPNIVQPAVNNIWPLDPSQWAMFLPRSPVQSVTSIVYADTPTTTQTLSPSTYIVDSDSEPARVTTAAGSFWPSAVFNPNAVQITFVAGYPAPTETITGTAAADVYTQTGLFNDQPVFTGDETNLSCWFNGSNWVLSTATGSNGASFWSGGSLSGSFSPGGSASGTAAGSYSSSVPFKVIQAILLLATHYYENRQSVLTGPGSSAIEVPMAVDSILDKLVIPWTWA
jgi:hypothetical protein